MDTILAMGWPQRFRRHRGLGHRESLILWSPAEFQAWSLKTHLDCMHNSRCTLRVDKLPRIWTNVEKRVIQDWNQWSC